MRDIIAFIAIKTGYNKKYILNMPMNDAIDIINVANPIKKSKPVPKEEQEEMKRRNKEAMEKARALRDKGD